MNQSSNRLAWGAVLRLRVGEEVTHLAAGDTSRWLVEMVTSGVADPGAVLSDNLRVQAIEQRSRISVLIKPRRPLIQTNLVIATTQRTYLIDLKSVDTMAYHSVVEWTYPKHVDRSASLPKSPDAPAPGSMARNYAYEIKAASPYPPRWAPESVYDDGGRVYVRFPKSINNHRRPPLFVVEKDGAVRLVNYHVEDRTYVVHELFDRAELRLGHERVVIDRVRDRPPNPITWLRKTFGLDD